MERRLCGREYGEIAPSAKSGRETSMVHFKARSLFVRIGILFFLFVANTERAAWAENITETQAIELIEALKAADLRVRLSATEALGRMGPSDKAAVPALIEALKDTNQHVRRKAAMVLGEIGPLAKAAVPALIEALKDTNQRVRGEAAFALSKIGPRAKAAVPALMEALKDTNQHVRGEAASALVKIRSSTKKARD